MSGAPSDPCARCGAGPTALTHTETTEQCEARMRAETNGRRGCWDPKDHHPYEPDGTAQRVAEGVKSAVREVVDLPSDIEAQLVGKLLAALWGGK